MKRKEFWLGAISGGIGGGFGATCGSNSLLICIFVGIGMALISAWLLSEFL